MRKIKLPSRIIKSQAQKLQDILRNEFKEFDPNITLSKLDVLTTTDVHEAYESVYIDVNSPRLSELLGKGYSMYPDNQIKPWLISYSISPKLFSFSVSLGLDNPKLKEDITRLLGVKPSVYTLTDSIPYNFADGTSGPLPVGRYRIEHAMQPHKWTLYFNLPVFNPIWIAKEEELTKKVLNTIIHRDDLVKVDDARIKSYPTMRQ
jgi:hypothetical protein